MEMEWTSKSKLSKGGVITWNAVEKQSELTFKHWPMNRVLAEDRDQLDKMANDNINEQLELGQLEWVKLMRVV